MNRDISSVSIHAINTETHGSDKEELLLLEYVFGKPVKPTPSIQRVALFILILTLIFIILNIKPISNLFSKYLSPNMSLVTKAIIFGIIALVLYKIIM